MNGYHFRLNDKIIVYEKWHFTSIVASFPTTANLRLITLSNNTS